MGVFWSAIFLHFLQKQSLSNASMLLFIQLLRLFTSTISKLSFQQTQIHDSTKRQINKEGKKQVSVNYRAKVKIIFKNKQRFSCISLILRVGQRLLKKNAQEK